MSKSKDHAPLEEQLQSSMLDSSKIEEFLANNGRMLFWISVGIAAFLVIAYIFTSSNQTRSVSDYLNAQKQYTAFDKSVKKEGINEGVDTQALTTLQGLLASHPELHAKYDGLLAQLLLKEGDITSAETYANATLARTLENPLNRSLSFYDDYSRTSLLISQANYSEAIQHSINLNTKLKAEISQQATTQSQFDSHTLYAFNLLRIAMLYQQLGLPLEEQKAWQELRQEAGWTDKGNFASMTLSSPFSLLLSHFQEGRISLIDYIDMRLKVLAPHGTT
jgi:hypothetical protein